MSPRCHAITIAIAIVVASGACGRHRRTPDDTLVIAIGDKATTVDPRYDLTNYDAMLSHLIAPGLTTVDTPDGSVHFALARSITPRDTDPSTIDIELADAVFSDGTPVTADDVARTFNSVLDPKCDSLYRTFHLARWTSFEARGPKLVTIHLVQPLGMLMTDLEFGVVSFHGVPAGECHPASVIGAGPYVLRELTPYGAELDANPFANPSPQLPHLRVHFVSDTAARILMLVGGSVDLLQNAVRGDLVDEVAQRPRVRVQAAPSNILTYMMLNLDDPILRDLRVREAIALALDRPAVIEARFEGRARLATGLLPTTSRYYEPNVATWSRDLPRARALLDDAGYRAGPDGTRLHLVYKTSSDQFRVSIARLLASQLADVGIDVEVRAFEFGTFFADVKKGDYQIASMQTAPITEPDFYFAYFHSSRIPDKVDPDAQNRWRYRNAELDHVTELGRHTLDPAARKPLYAIAQQLVARDLPIIPLWHEDNVVLSNVDVAGYQIVANARLAGLAQSSK
jgi:peptide/nickel transport system substrate-binding protein